MLEREIIETVNSNGSRQVREDNFTEDGNGNDIQVLKFPPPSFADEALFTSDVDTSALDADIENHIHRDLIVYPSNSATSNTSIRESETMKPDGTRVVRKETIDESGFVLEVEIVNYPHEDKPAETKDTSAEEVEHYMPDGATTSENHNDAEKQEEDKICNVPKRLFWKLTVIAILVLIAVGATVGAVVSSGNDDTESSKSLETDPPTPDMQTPTTPPPTVTAVEPTSTLPPTRIVTSQMLALAAILIPSVDLSTLSIFSASYRALEWLLEDDQSGISLNEDSSELQERFGLATLYFSTNGKGWINRENWLSPNSVCIWIGLSCDDATNSVIALTFNANNLQGKIPGELGKLSQLRIMNLQQNSLTGSLPSGLGLLTNLGTLNVYSNAFIGSIPTEFGNMQSLSDLVLWQNKLQGSLPSEMGKLLQLTNLDLAENGLQEALPTELGRLLSLRKLFLDNNKFEGSLPRELGLLQNLELLYVRNNLFTDLVPQELQDCPNLLDVTLDSNDFTGGLEFLFCGRSMIQFYSDCGEGEIVCRCCTHCCAELFVGCFKPSSTLAPTMAPTNRLDVFADILLPPNGIDLMLSNTSSPQYKALAWLSDQDYPADQPIQDTLDLQERFALAVLYHATNGDNWIDAGSWLTPGLPICNWDFVTCLASRVRFVRLNDNNLEGSIPVELEKLSSLRSLELTENPLTSSIPTELGRLSLLSNLELWTNDLSGSIPTELSELSFLTSLNVAMNRLTGTIPPSVSGLINLRLLELGSNSLSGNIPTEIGELRLLLFLGLHENSLTAQLPTELGQLTLLETLQLYENSLTAGIPSEYALMTSLTSLQVHDNELTGILPTQLMGLPLLEYFRVSANNLRGSIHTEISNLSRLTYFNVQQNDFTGAVPSQIGMLTDLTSLSLAFTNLTGDIPSEMENLVNLDLLFLHGIQATGGLDNFFCNRRLSFFFADCRGASPEISCTCCNYCCNNDGDACINRS